MRKSNIYLKEKDEEKNKDSKRLGTSPAAEDTLSNIVSLLFFIIAWPAND